MRASVLLCVRQSVKDGTAAFGGLFRAPRQPGRNDRQEGHRLRTVPYDFSAVLGLAKLVLEPLGDFILFTAEPPRSFGSMETGRPYTCQ